MRTQTSRRNGRWRHFKLRLTLDMQ